MDTDLHALFLIRDVAKLPGLLSPNFSRFFRAAVPYLSLIFCPFLYPCVSYDFIKILKFLAASLQNEKSIFCLLLISTLPLASLIFPENSSPVSYWPSLINNNACKLPFRNSGKCITVSICDQNDPIRGYIINWYAHRTARDCKGAITRSHFKQGTF